MGFCLLRLPFSGIPFWTSPAVFDDHYMSYIYILLVENLHLWMIFPLKTSSSGIQKNLPKVVMALLLNERCGGVSANQQTELHQYLINGTDGSENGANPQSFSMGKVINNHENCDATPFLNKVIYIYIYIHIHTYTYNSHT